MGGGSGWTSMGKGGLPFKYSPEENFGGGRWSYGGLGWKEHGKQPRLTGTETSQERPSQTDRKNPMYFEHNCTLAHKTDNPNVVIFILQSRYFDSYTKV